MKAACSSCHAEYNIDDARIPPEGLQLQCPRCREILVVQRDRPADEPMELDLPEEPLNTPAGTTDSPAPLTSTLPPVGGSFGSSTLPSIGNKVPPPPETERSLFDSPPSRTPSPAKEGQIFDFIDNEISSPKEPEPAEKKQVRYRIRRKSGKIFGPFDAATIKKMLTEHKLMGNEEASTDGHTFKALGAIDEFAEVIRTLMDEPVTDPGTAARADPPSVVTVAEPLIRLSRARSRAPLYAVGGLVLLVAIAGLSLGFTRFGFFGIRLLVGQSRVSSLSPEAIAESRKSYFEDTYAGYMAVIRKLGPLAKEDTLGVEDLALLGLSYAALLRNYGANAAFLESSREVQKQLNELSPDSPEQRKLDAALSLPTDPARAQQIVTSLIGPETRDQESLYLAGWAAALQKNWAEAAKAFDRATVIDPNYTKAYHSLGDIQSLQGDFDSALSFYEKALEKNPRHVNSAVEIARIAIEVKRDMDRGERMVAVALGQHQDTLSASERAKAYHLRAQIAQSRRQPDRVLQDLNTAIQLMPNQTEYQTALGNVLLEQRDYGKAQQQFALALERDPKNIDARIGSGRCLWKTGDIVKGHALLEAAHKDAPNDPRPLYFLGLVAEELHKPDEAQALFGKAIGLAPRFLEPRVSLARLALDRGDLEAALDQLTQAGKIDPHSALVHVGLGQVYLRQKNYRLAQDEFESALRLEPNLAEAHFHLASTLREQGRLAEAVAEYQKTAALAPRYPGLPREQGTCLLQQGQAAEALTLFENAIRETPRDDRLYVQAGLSLRALARHDEAIKYFQSAVGLNKTNPNALYELARVFQEKGDHEQAISLLKQAADLDRTRADIHFAMGLSYLKTELTGDAIEEFRQAIQLQPDNIEARVSLGHALEGRQQYQEAIEQFERVLRAEPNRIDMLLSLGDADAARGFYNKALSRYQNAYKKAPTAPGCAYRLARAFDELNRKPLAIKHYLEAIELDPKDPMPHFYLGHVYKAQNKNALAISSFKRYLKLRPDADDAAEVRDEIDYLSHEP